MDKLDSFSMGDKSLERDLQVITGFERLENRSKRSNVVKCHRCDTPKVIAFAPTL